MWLRLLGLTAAYQCWHQGAAIFDSYTHFALINNGMRGPFVAAEDGAARQHWAAPFLGLLSREVKLAGNYLSCELGVHLQGPFLVTDRSVPSKGRQRLMLVDGAVLDTEAQMRACSFDCSTAQSYRPGTPTYPCSHHHPAGWVCRS